MGNGLKTTLELLARTPNEAADGALLPALDHPRDSIQKGALSALLRRRSVAGQQEIVRRLPELDEHSRKIIADRAGSLLLGLRDAIQGRDEAMFAIACDAALWLRNFDLVPTLIAVLEDPSNPLAERAGQTLVELVDLLLAYVSGPQDVRDRRDPELLRRHVIESLENSVKRMSKDGRIHSLEALLLLVNRHNALLKRILADPLDNSHVQLVRTLLHCHRKGVFRLLTSYLNEPHTDSAILNVIGRRADVPFVAYLMEAIGPCLDPTVAQNLRRIEHFAWAEGPKDTLDALDDAGQQTAVNVIMASGMRRLDCFANLEYMLRNGKLGGRRAAVVALADFHGAEANSMLTRALADPDPEVQSLALRQIRGRGIPGALNHLIQALDSPHESMRTAARECLAEFNFPKFLSAFDTLDDDVRQSTARLVRKVDTRTVEMLVAELQAPARSRRLRGLEITEAADIVGELEEAVIALLMQDGDHMIRVAAARALSNATSAAAREALLHAREDRSSLVQEAAEQSLAMIDEMLEQQKLLREAQASV